jgi:hypothetical protein
MTHSPRIGVFYSKGRTYLDVLRSLREEDPGAHVCAIVPAEYPVSRDESSLADEVIRIERSRYSWRDIRPLRRLMRQIRAARLDAFVILFDSPRLRILAALSGAKRCAYCTMDRRLVEVRPSVAATLANVVIRTIWGRLVYTGIWLAVHLLHVPSPNEPTPNR